MRLDRPLRHALVLFTFALSLCGVATLSVVAHADVGTTPVSVPPFPTPTIDPLKFNRTIDISPTKGKPGTIIQVSGDCGSPYHQMVAGLVATADPNSSGPLVGGELTIFYRDGDGKTQTFDGTLTVPRPPRRPD